MKKIAVFTSGGDAPGMNAAIRAVVRACVYYGVTPVGIFQGYDGMIRGEFQEMNSRSVSNIIQQGGTILKSARSEAFRTEAGREMAFNNLYRHGIDGLVAIGGNGTLTGAHEFHKKYKIPVVGIPATIDNDLDGTDFTLGYDTATNAVVSAIDVIRDTASSHNRLFFIEVMGRYSGFIALRSAIAAGAEAMLIPEDDIGLDKLIAVLERGMQNNKSSILVIVAEAGKSGRTFQIAEEVNRRFSYYEAKVTILGHLQRGGSPTCFDRVLASRLGVAAIETLLAGKTDVMVGRTARKVKATPLSKIIKQEKEIDKELLRVAEILAI
ncbi:MAG: 6-phosphofructokinase [Bacteroidetes bacterium]|nr:6-phosphofructokinase [Bacteroidota bacterium]